MTGGVAPPGDNMMSPDGKTKMDVKDEGNLNSEPQKPKVVISSSVLFLFYGF